MPSIINATTSTGLVSTADNSGSLQLATNNGTTAVTIDTSQNVLAGGTTAIDGGVGVQVGNASAGNAKSTLQLLGNTNSWVQFGNGLSGASRYLGWVQYNYASNYMTFATNSTERMRITSDGSFVVGRTSVPTFTDTTGVGFAYDSTYQTTFFVQNNATSFAATYFNATSFTSGTAYFCQFRVNGVTKGNITSDGSTTTYATTSDYRLKENIAPMTGALDKVAQLKPVTYKWKESEANGQGFIAHELQAVVPDCVTGEKDEVDADGNPKYQGIDTSFLVATLTAAIQELNAKVEAQAVRIAELEGAK